MRGFAGSAPGAAAVVAVLALLAVACGGGSEGSGSEAARGATPTTTQGVAVEEDTSTRAASSPQSRADGDTTTPVSAGETATSDSSSPTNGGTTTPVSAGETATSESSPRASGTPAIAFVSDRDGNNEIYVMNSDGSGQTRLTSNAADDIQPAWSPDGTRIAFASDRDDPRSGACPPPPGCAHHIYVMDADGGNQSRLTPVGGRAASVTSPTWSPDGTRIVYSGTDDILVFGVLVSVNTEGSDIRVITDPQAEGASYFMDVQPDWSPDGRHLVFSAVRSAVGFSSIYITDADGTAVQRVTVPVPGQADQDPSWSPDGSRIAYSSSQLAEPGADIHVLQVERSQSARLTDSASVDSTPTWSPDGSQLAFESDRDGDREIYVMNADGTNQTKLTNDPGQDGDPSWSPVVPAVGGGDSSRSEG